MSVELSARSFATDKNKLTIIGFQKAYLKKGKQKEKTVKYHHLQNLIKHMKCFSIFNLFYLKKILLFYKTYFSDNKCKNIRYKTKKVSN